MDNNGITNMSGFYKKCEDGNWLYAENFVYGPGFDLLKELKDTYEYPIDGWVWNDTEPDGFLQE